MTKDQVRSTEEALDLALEALKELVAQTEARLFAVKHDHVALQNAREAITAIKQARSAPVQEPVAWMHKETGLLRQANKAKGGDFEPNHWTPLYTTPPAQRQWVWLTDEDIEQEFGFIDELLRDCVHRTEAKVREKNT